MRKDLQFAIGLLAGGLILLSLAAANYTTLTPQATTNAINAAIASAAATYNGSQFTFMPLTLKSGATATNTSLTTPTITYPTVTGGTITGGTNSATALLSVTTPGLVGLLYANNSSAMYVTNVINDTRIFWTNFISDLPSIAAGDHFDVTHAFTGAGTNSTVLVTVDGGGQTNIVLQAWINATNSVTMRAINTWTAAADPASAVYRFTVFMQQ